MKHVQETIQTPGGLHNEDLWDSSMRTLDTASTAWMEGMEGMEEMEEMEGGQGRVEREVPAESLILG